MTLTVRAFSRDLNSPLETYCQINANNTDDFIKGTPLFSIPIPNKTGVGHASAKT